MTVKNFLYYLSLILIVVGGIFGLNTVGSDNELISLLNDIFLILATVYILFIIIYMKKYKRKKVGDIVETIVPLLEEKKYDECEEYLKKVIKKSFYPGTTMCAHAYLTIVYLFKNELDKARFRLNHWYIGNHILVMSHRIDFALYDNDLNKAKSNYSKFEKIINKKLYGATKLRFLEILEDCKKFIDMYETKEFDQELYDKIIFDYAKDLCLRYKKEA